MRYIGSKSSTLAAIGDLVRRRAPHAASICDPFAGTCAVARHFKRAGLRIVTGDMLSLSHVIQTASIGLNASPAFVALRGSGVLGLGSPLSHLSGLSPTHGYVAENFSPAGAEGRMFFTPENAGLIDAVRATIAGWSDAGLTTSSEEAYLLATLIVSADKVANTAGTYYAHLKKFDRKALRKLELVPMNIVDNGVQNSCSKADAVAVAAEADADILYLDPPYNGRDYARYYHLPETIVLGDEAVPHGRSGVPPRRAPTSSAFCRAGTATAAMERLLKGSGAPHVIVHYTPRGLIPHDEMLRMLKDRGHTTWEDVEVRSYAADRTRTPGATVNRLYWCDRARR